MENTSTQKILAGWFWTLFIIFMFMSVGSHAFGWMKNSTCMPHLGCNTGFFGYDGLVHFIGGVTIAVGVMWIMRAYPATHLFHPKFWKNILIVLAIAALIGVCWEILEFIFDHVRMDIFHVNLIHPNVMAQASNSDTIGDLSLGLFGALISSFVMKLFKSDIF